MSTERCSNHPNTTSNRLNHSRCMCPDILVTLIYNIRDGTTILYTIGMHSSWAQAAIASAPDMATRMASTFPPTLGAADEEAKEDQAREHAWLEKVAHRLMWNREQPVVDYPPRGTREDQRYYVHYQDWQSNLPNTIPFISVGYGVAKAFLHIVGYDPPYRGDFPAGFFPAGFETYEAAATRLLTKCPNRDNINVFHCHPGHEPRDLSSKETQEAQHADQWNLSRDPTVLHAVPESSNVQASGETIPIWKSHALRLLCAQCHKGMLPELDYCHHCGETNPYWVPADDPTDYHR